MDIDVTSSFKEIFGPGLENQIKTLTVILVGLVYVPRALSRLQQVDPVCVR